MLTPQNSNNPNPQSPRDKDEWIAILIAFGVIGSIGAWAFLSGFPSARLNAVRSDLPAVALPDSAQSDRSNEDDDGSALALPFARDSDDTIATDEDEPLRATNNRVATQDEDAAVATGPAVPNQAALDAQPIDEVPTDTVPTEPETAEEPTNGIVAVPEPEQPEGVEGEPLNPEREPVAFSDVQDGYWGKPYIDSLTSLGVLSGFNDGTYAPDRPVTRAELAVQVAEAFAIDQNDPPENFTDITDDYWAAENINEAVTTGFMTGYPDATFQPDQQVPRVEVLVAIVTGLDLPESSTPDQTLQSYEDQDAVPGWARGKFAAALEAGLLKVNPEESDARLLPEQDATRAEVAGIIHNALARLGQVDPIDAGATK